MIQLPLFLPARSTLSLSFVLSYFRTFVINRPNTSVSADGEKRFLATESREHEKKEGPGRGQDEDLVLVGGVVVRYEDKSATNNELRDEDGSPEFSNHATQIGRSGEVGAYLMSFQRGVA